MPWVNLARAEREDFATFLETLSPRVAPPGAPATVMRAFKGRTVRVLRAEFGYLGRFGNMLWSPSYLAAPVGYVSESTVRRYIEHQWDAVA